MIETYKLMTGKYDHKIVNFMPKQHDSSTSLPTRGHQLKLYRQRAENVIGPPGALLFDRDQRLH